MAIIEFIFDYPKSIIIKGNKNEKIGGIIDKFAIKARIDKKSYLFINEGKKINEELRLEEMIYNNNKLKILVYNNTKEIEENKENVNLIDSFIISNHKRKKSNYNKSLIKIFPIIIILILLLSNSKKNLKVCLCLLSKQENLYIKEYVTHYKQLGFNHIFLYDNNEINGEKFEDVIQDEIKSKFVSIINFRGLKGPQGIAYKDCYKKNSKNYDWLSFFDTDEFLEFKPPIKTIQEFLNNKRYKKCVTVKINFLFYSDNELLYYDPRPLKIRFNTPLFNHTSNGVIKTIVKGGLPINYWEIGFTPHTSHMNVTSCNCRGELLNPDDWYTPFEFKYAALRHYYTKSTQEYINKCIRGEGDFSPEWNERRKRLKIFYYFLFNKRTKEKEALLMKSFNLSSK